jgi:predicted transcriptional regulator YdeE
MKLIGLKLPHPTRNQNGDASRDCGGLWQAFTSENIAQKIPNKKSDNIYTVYYDYVSDHNGDYSYFIGCEVPENTPVPEGLHELYIPEQYYQIITAKGQMPDCIAEAWRKIWSTSINRAYGFDLEVYDERSADWSNAEVDIYLSIY